MEHKLKDSGIPWIGKIPKHWDIARVKDIYSFQTGATPPSKTESFYDGDNLWANIGDINCRTIYETSKHLSDEGISVCSMNISPKGSLLYSFKLSVGQVAFCGVDMYTNEAIATFIGDSISLSYLYYVAPLFIIFNANTNIYGAPILNQDLIKNALIPLPPLTEQGAIAAYLDKKCGEIDELIEVEQQMISDLEAYRKSVITEAVTHGLNPDAPLRDSGVDFIGQVPEHWRVIPVQHFFEFRNGYTPSKSNASFWSNGTIPWFRMEDIRRSGRFLKDALQYITPQAMNNGGKFEAGSFILAICTASIGEHALLIADSLANQQFTNLKIRKSLANCVDTQFVFYYMFILGKFCKETSIVTTFPYADMNRVKNFIVPTPTLAEQQAIADYLDAKCAEIDELIKVKQEKIETLKQYRQSLIFEAVTGKTTIS